MNRSSSSRSRQSQANPPATRREWGPIAFAFLVVAGLAAGFALLFPDAVKRRAHAMQEFQRAQMELDTLAARRAELEARVEALQESVDAVELQARVEYRLIHRGERIELIQPY
ncbi:MAG: septum formation initiator family protein [Sumerlaeia bacterium]